MHFKLTTSVLVASLVAVSPAAALASTDGPPNRIDAASHARTMHSLAVLHEQLDARAEAIAAPAKTAPATTTRIVTVSEGFSWVDGAIGAGVTAAVLLAAAGAQAARRLPSTTAH
ncbi:hypothetical protein OM076_27550 [Solirubrobacter ginsenosidimutans]|uniref:PDGLE domain-containing protein n=1 Tax=Solirubrobacter ginsenosidimutans TaxID=490573 RepID=A0A9X3MWK9_9ACTN|nr:hypothetical protein [Solirubrobacter ginsenosidimutans]MDA0164059.1 hypothetical protein [Solirubrobacter ginsenosidimutans]